MRRELWSALRQYALGRADLSPIAVVTFGTLVGLISFALLAGYELQRTIREDVLDKVGIPEHASSSLRHSGRAPAGRCLSEREYRSAWKSSRRGSANWGS